MIAHKLVSFSELKAHSQEITSLCLSNSKIASASEDKTIKVWRSKSGKLTTTKVFESDANSLAFTPDEQILISGESDNTIKLWSLYHDNLIRTLNGHQKAVNSVAVHPKGKLIASASDDKTVKLWSFESNQPVCTLSGHTDGVMAVCFSPDGKVLASSGDINDKTVNLWFLSEDRRITLKGHSDWFGGIYALAFSPDGKLIASGSKDKTVKIWEVDTGIEVMTLKGHDDDITSIAINGNNQILASGSKDKNLKLWELTTGKLISTIKHPEKIQVVTFSPNRKILATGYGKGNIRLFKPQPKLSNSLQELLN